VLWSQNWRSVKAAMARVQCRSFSGNIILYHLQRTSTEFPTKSNQSRVPVLTVFAGEIEEVDFVMRFGHVGAVVVEASDTDVVQHSDEHVLFSDNMCGVVMT
jgi:hypothetical protein